MTGKKIGYVRVSSFDQNPERQLGGISLNKKFIDKSSGKDSNRPALTEFLNYAREDDSMIVYNKEKEPWKLVYINFHFIRAQFNMQQIFQLYNRIKIKIILP